MADPNATIAWPGKIQDINGNVLVVNADGSINSSPAKSATGTQTNVADSATSASLLAANTNRKGATVFNDSTAILYLLLVTGGTASATAFTIQIAAGGYYEVPFGYTGALIGIWASDTAGSARITEFT